MVEIKNLSVSYRTHTTVVPALADLTLSVGQGEICSIVGPSGCGKSTLLHVLAGICTRYGGSVTLDGVPVDPHRHRIGLVLQNYGLLPWKNVYQNALLGLRIAGIPASSHPSNVDDILQSLDLMHLLRRYPSQLSGGQRQRVAIARAFILQPSLLLMDEPFSALDAITREQSQDLFLQVWQRNPVPTLFVTHSIEEALCVGSRIAVMSPSPGRIVHIFDNPLFMEKDVRMQKEFYAKALEIRSFVKEAWLHVR